MIFVGKRPVQVDFKVFESKSYTFFLDEELCRINLEKNENNKYTYSFDIVKDIDTPLNQERKQIRKRDRRNSILGILGFFVLAGLVIGGWHYIYKSSLAKDLAKNGVVTEGRLDIEALTNSYYVRYVYKVGHRFYSRNIEYYKNPNPISKNGFPMVDGDQFYVKYSTKNPDNSVLYLDQPTPSQLRRYHVRSRAEYLKQHPDQDTTFSNCLLDIAFDLKGLDGYADFYFLATPPSQNKRHNMETFNELVQSEPFLKKEKQCW